MADNPHLYEPQRTNNFEIQFPGLGDLTSIDQGIALPGNATDLLTLSVKSVSYPNSKAKHLVEMSQMLVKDFGGEVPSEMDDLLKLPGVGRKTANVMQSVVWGKATMAVDTHVFRVSHRLGLVPESCNTPLKVELELVKLIADEDIPKAHHWLLLHGRYICQSRTPHCEKCGLQPWCKHFLGQ